MILAIHTGHTKNELNHFLSLEEQCLSQGEKISSLIDRDLAQFWMETVLTPQQLYNIP